MAPGRSTAITIARVLAALMAAHILGSTLRDAAPVAPKAVTLTIATAVVIAGIVFDPGSGLASVSPLVDALAHGCALAIGAGLLIGMNTAAPTAVSRTITLSIGVAILVFALEGTLRFFAAVLRSPSQARLGVFVMVGLAGAAPLWLGSIAEGMSEVKGFVDAVVAVSPVTYLAVMGDCDYLRTDWFYTRSVIGSLRFDYPGAFVLSAIYVVLGVICFSANRRLSTSGWYSPQCASQVRS